MAVEARLADEELHAAAELGGELVDGGAHAVERGAVTRDGGLGDAGRGAGLAAHAAQRAAPLASRHANAGGDDGRLHDVAAFLGSTLQIGDRGPYGLIVAFRA